MLRGSPRAGNAHDCLIAATQSGVLQFSELLLPAALLEDHDRNGLQHDLDILPQ